MTYKCLECGHIFEDGEKKHLVEHYEYWGQPCSETIYVCPICNGNYEEAETCEECGGYFLADELEDGLCEKCRDWEI